MPTITDADLGRMRGELLYDGPEQARKLSRFWMLLLLAAVIATAGAVTDSTATVIGAMIVAPLMTPILGTVLSVVTADGRNLLVSLELVVAGSAAVVAVSVVFGLLVPYDVVAETSSQVAGRVSPRLADLIAALATGAVGSFALVRSDVSDTLPGVAIAISLVPPLCVVGLTLEAGAGDQSLGALLLFLTNVGAILLSGLVVMALYRVRRPAAEAAARSHVSSRGAAVVVTVSVLALCVPLAASTARISSETITTMDVTEVAEQWASAAGWEVLSVDLTEDFVVVRADGPLPVPDAGELRALLDEAGLENVDVRVELQPEYRVDLPGQATTE
jgi:uncharacterized hydrophobic protein (TIGR00271 family)